MSVPELKRKPYWLDTTSIPEGDASDPLPESVDIAVIGGGITGLSAARALARRGAKVAVFEAETFGWGASSRNGGMVLTGLKKGPGTLIARYGSKSRAASTPHHSHPLTVWNRLCGRKASRAPSRARAIWNWP